MDKEKERRFYLVTFYIDTGKYFNSIAEVININGDLKVNKEKQSFVLDWMERRLGYDIPIKIFHISEITVDEFSHFSKEINYPF